MFTCKAVEAAVAEREGALPQRLRLRQQQHRTTGLRGREAVVAAVGHFHRRRLFLYLGLYLDPDPGPSPFRVNSASPASLCCSLSFPGRPGALAERYCPYRRPGTRWPCHRLHPAPWTCPADWPARRLLEDRMSVGHQSLAAPAKLHQVRMYDNKEKNYLEHASSMITPGIQKTAWQYNLNLLLTFISALDCYNWKKIILLHVTFSTVHMRDSYPKNVDSTHSMHMFR